MWLFVVVVDCGGGDDDSVRAQPDYDDGPRYLWPAYCHIIRAQHTRERVCIHRANNNYYYLFV